MRKEEDRNDRCACWNAGAAELHPDGKGWRFALGVRLSRLAKTDCFEWVVEVGRLECNVVWAMFEVD